MTATERQDISVKTYHAFCIEALQAHGRLLNGKTPRFVYPRQERVLKAAHDGKWPEEVERLRLEESRFCFDAVAKGAADLYEGSALIRRLYAQRFPLLIVDEFQDTDDDQWRLVRSLASHTTLVCLADPEQRIFEYRGNVNPKRLDQLREERSPYEFDLGSDNHRSPNAGVLGFADAILKNTSLPVTKDVETCSYPPKKFADNVHLRVVTMFNRLRKAGVTEPTVAVLARGNALVATMSADLSAKRQATFQGRTVELPAIEHSVVWDAEMTVAAAAVVASVLEWAAKDATVGVADTLRAVAGFYRQKNALKATASAKNAADKFAKSAARVAEGKTPAQKAAKALIDLRALGNACSGDVIEDWRQSQKALEAITEMKEVVAESRMLRLFRARDEIVSALAGRWLEKGSYLGAARLVERALDRQVLTAADRDARGCVLMSIHKSKGKEFDGVVIVEGMFSSPFFDTAREQPPYEFSRRLLRVAITRARTAVTLIRPVNALPLVG